MTYAEVNDLIEGMNIPYAYYQFPKGTGQQPPFICFFYPENNDLIADNKNYAPIKTLVIELYTAYKDFELEEQIETVLKNAELPFDREETPLDSEQMYLVVFTTSIIVTDEIDESEGE